MRETIRHNIKTPYSLHDMNVIAFEVIARRWGGRIWRLCRQNRLDSQLGGRGGYLPLFDFCRFLRSLLAM